jgi:hypothetical protein
MIQCPKCSKQLPDWSQACQFCQADLKGVVRPKPDPKTSSARATLSGPAPWIWPAYYCVAAYFVVSGLLSLIQAIYLMSKPTLFGGPNVVAIVGIIVSVVTIIIGLGLILKIEAARGVVNFFCWLSIAANILSLPGTIGMISLLPGLGLVATIRSVFDICTAALMIYLIGETD